MLHLRVFRFSTDHIQRLQRRRIAQMTILSLPRMWRLALILTPCYPTAPAMAPLLLLQVVGAEAIGAGRFACSATRSGTSPSTPVEFMAPEDCAKQQAIDDVHCMSKA